MSGDLVEGPALAPSDRFLREPFGVDALARAVAELAAGPATVIRRPETPVEVVPGPR